MKSSNHFPFFFFFFFYYEGSLCDWGVTVAILVIYSLHTCTVLITLVCGARACGFLRGALGWWRSRGLGWSRGVAWGGPLGGCPAHSISWRRTRKAARTLFANIIAPTINKLKHEGVSTMSSSKNKNIS
uniref:Uncharacterized protein n=1 Tax=Ixodes ricinus TaxID=34613 RepID=A0A6B0UQM6_IXORI